MFFTSHYRLCSLRLLKIKTEGRIILVENITNKPGCKIEIKAFAELGLASSGFEQPGPCGNTTCYTYSFKEVLFIFFGL